MPNKLSLTQIITTLGATIALIGGVFAIDARYVKDADLEQAKNEIIGELRSEVAKNRWVMITSMQREADDIEFKIEQLKESGQDVPRYLKEKFKQITRTIEDLKDVEKDSD